MKNETRSLALFAAFAAGCAVWAEPAWRDPAVNSENREPAHAWTVPLDSAKDAFSGELEPTSPYVRSLNGTWKFYWCGAWDQRPKNFWSRDFDDSTWAKIAVPSCVDLQGWGAPNYTNSEYPFPVKPPFTPENESAVASYRTTFTTPDAWANRQVLLRFEGVGAAATVWLNGRRVGYTEDAMLPAEFDVTRHLCAAGGQNVLAVQVLQRCDGTYLEDQDFFRFWGIFRDVALVAVPTVEIRDYHLKTKFAPGYAKATCALDVEIRRHARTESPESMHRREWLSAELYDAASNRVASVPPFQFDLPNEGGRRVVTLEFTVDKPHLWNAEDPALYFLVMQAGEKPGARDVRAARVGFRETRIEGNVLLVNGRPIKFHGVNRHETSPTGGRTVSLDEMRNDVFMFKRFNVDTVRTSHYPNHRLWYALCDKYGVYVMAEANVEAHGIDWSYRATDKLLGFRPEWKKAIVERNRNNVLAYRNHPGVFCWSLGNETGAGENFAAARDAIKEADPSRPVHYEGNIEAMDLDSCMYPSVDWVKRRAAFGEGRTNACEHSYAGAPGRNHTATKPLFVCEYAHAMGNALGNFKEYWEVFDAHPCLAGGCIWDWKDQAVWQNEARLGTDGRLRRHLAYGGDFDDKPNMGPFCCNGVVDALSRVSPKLREVAHVHRPLALNVRNADEGEAVLWNRTGFTPANRFSGRWALWEDGEEIARGVLAVPDVAPGDYGEIELPQPLPFARKAQAEYFYVVEFATREATPWAPAGHVVAREQIPWGEKPQPPTAQTAAGRGSYTVDNASDLIRVVGEGVDAVFSRETGTLAKLTLNGRHVLAENGPLVAGPRLDCVRAFTDNDKWLRKDFYAKGLTQLHHHPERLDAGRDETGRLLVETYVRVTSAKSAGFRLRTRWIFQDGGSVRVENRAEPFGAFPPALPRLGLLWRLDGALENVCWYGRGPFENYVDRNSAAFVGRYRSTVTGQYEAYVRPQENGAKTDVRWVAFTDDAGQGVRFEADVGAPFIFQALHYDWEDLEFARHRNGEERRLAPLQARPEVLLRLDCRQTGLGGASCGPQPLEKYTYRPAEPVEWAFTLSAVGAKEE